MVSHTPNWSKGWHGRLCCTAALTSRQPSTSACCEPGKLHHSHSSRLRPKEGAQVQLLALPALSWGWRRVPASAGTKAASFWTCSAACCRPWQAPLCSFVPYTPLRHSGICFKNASLLDAAPILPLEGSRSPDVCLPAPALFVHGDPNEGAGPAPSMGASKGHEKR